MKKLYIQFANILFTIAVLFPYEQLIAQVVHDISQSPLIISASSTQNYEVSGSTTANYIEVQTGYKGTITLHNLSINVSDNHPPIALRGLSMCSNSSPVTQVQLILQGTNEIIYAGSRGYAALQVEQGAQLNISAINPKNNNSGILSAINATEKGGAGIGALNRWDNNDEATGDATIIGNCKSPALSAGGNITVSSGVVTAIGGHGAGIGGGYLSFYDGTIIIYGGEVKASSLYHAAGIGSGCPLGLGLESCYASNSSIIVLPPALISAKGAAASSSDEKTLYSLGLAGAKDIFYIGDKAKPLVKVRTIDNQPSANIYVDLSQEASISTVINRLLPPGEVDLNKLKFGETNAQGLYTFNGVLKSNTTFFTDAFSISPDTYGRPYVPETKMLPNGGEVVLRITMIDIALHPYKSTSLRRNYSVQQAQNQCSRVKIEFKDPLPMTDVKFEYANGDKTDFENIQFYAADSITPIAAPTSFVQGSKYYLAFPIKQNKPLGIYTDVIRITGIWNGYSASVIRHIIRQDVVHAISVKACENKYFFNGNILNKSGFYTDTLKTEYGNDSIVELNLAVIPTYRDTTKAIICSNETFTFRAKSFDKTVFYSDTLTTALGCDSILSLQLKVQPSAQTLVNHILRDIDLPYTCTDTVFNKGTKSGNYVFRKKSVNGCDSTITHALKVNLTFNAALNTAPSICANDPNFELTYQLLRGKADKCSVYFGVDARSAGFVDIINTSANGNSILVPLPARLMPNSYSAIVQLENDDAYIQKLPFQFTVNYPSNIVIQKWNDVLALLNTKYNGGYDFSSYQWYKNNQPLAGETKSYLYISNNTLDVNAVYTVAVTRATDGVKLFVCPVTPVFKSNQQKIPTIYSKGDQVQLVVSADARLVFWNLSGLKISEHALKKGVNSCKVPTIPGTYLIDIHGIADEIKQLVVVK